MTDRWLRAPLRDLGRSRSSAASLSTNCRSHNHQCPRSTTAGRPWTRITAGAVTSARDVPTLRQGANEGTQSGVGYGSRAGPAGAATPASTQRCIPHAETALDASPGDRHHQPAPSAASRTPKQHWTLAPVIDTTSQHPAPHPPRRNSTGRWPGRWGRPFRGWRAGSRGGVNARRRGGPPRPRCRARPPTGRGPGRRRPGRPPRCRRSPSPG
jgi:hypothetical protein